MKYQSGVVLVAALIFLGFLSLIALDELRHTFVALKQLQNRQSTLSQHIFVEKQLFSYLNQSSTLGTLMLVSNGQSVAIQSASIELQITHHQRSVCQWNTVLSQCDWLKVCAIDQVNISLKQCVHIQTQKQLMGSFLARWRVYSYYPRGAS
ncbi:hypothetical protein DBZ36_03000 [Alginatibacterium sediminis]|uniref:DUF2509 family protein n=1 Tax=Alginatibacterium sediminis TaxID=2164068 RepID=A0A420EJP7_9ALTE|nr:hypothetical protein [Alginatibacterium sediminis]RKF20925.1 hypothetical protein DBZ36_03000 [Alginatibacterium sediminis]